jgi:hypothetical protein
VTDGNYVFSDISLKLASWGVFTNSKQQIEEEEKDKDKGLKISNEWS